MPYASVLGTFISYLDVKASQHAFTQFPVSQVGEHKMRLYCNGRIKVALHGKLRELGLLKHVLTLILTLLESN